MDKKDFDGQLRRQCFDIPEMCPVQLEGIKKGLAESIPAEVLKNIRTVIMTGCGDSYLAAIAAVPAFKKYAGAFGNNFIAMRCIEVSRFLKMDFQDPNAVLVIGISASGGPSRVVETLERANSHGYHSLVVTNNPESKCAQAAEYTMIVNTPPFPEWGPGCRNYYASILGLFALAAKMGEAKGLQKPGTVNELLSMVATFTASYKKSLVEIDNQIFEVATTWKDHVGIETLADHTLFSSAYFVGAKYVEVAGIMASTTDSENWCHVNYFKHNTEKMGLLVIANKKDNNRSRISETIYQAHAIGRPIVLVTDGTKEDFGVAEDVVVITVPEAPVEFEFFAPLMNYIPGSILASYIASIHEEPYFRGSESLQKRSKIGCKISDSDVVIL